MEGFQRTLTPLLKQTAATFPVVTLTGPRQSGKTTLLKRCFPDYHYINLEDPDTVFRVKSDPRDFLSSHPSKVIIDEAQKFPELFSYLQGHVDTINEPGMFILSGSQNFLLTDKINQTLAGRTAILQLLPLNHQEYLSHPKFGANDIWEYLYSGSYPRPYQEALDLNIWYSSYINTYLERDVRSLLNIRDLVQFQLFLKMCAGRHGQLLNLNGLASDCGISHATVREWLSVLEASYIVYRLSPYHKNFNKRLVKTQKLYFYDSAIVCHLLGIQDADHLRIHSARGAIFEGFVISEIMKYTMYQTKTLPLYFWRDQTGLEMDCLIERGEDWHAVEIKSGKTLNPDVFKQIARWQKASKTDSAQMSVIYAGDKSYTQKGMQILSWADIYAYCEQTFG